MKFAQVLLHEGPGDQGHAQARVLSHGRDTSSSYTSTSSKDRRRKSTTTTRTRRPAKINSRSSSTITERSRSSRPCRPTTDDRLVVLRIKLRTSVQSRKLPSLSSRCLACCSILGFRFSSFSSSSFRISFDFFSRSSGVH